MTVSFGSGILMSIVIGAVYLMSIASLDQSTKGWNSKIIMACITVSWMLAGLVIRFAFWEKVPGEVFIFPTDWRFEKYFFTMLSAGFGIDIDSRQINPRLAATGVVGIFCFIMVLIPPGYSTIRAAFTRNWKLMNFGALAIVAALIATLGAIALGRSVAWDIGADGKSSRYVEITIFLLPTCAAWYWSLFTSRTFRNCFQTALFLVTFGFFLNDWNFSGVYTAWVEPRRAGAECIKKYYETGLRPAVCKEIYPNCGPTGCVSLAEYLDFFKGQKFTFLDDLGIRR